MNSGRRHWGNAVLQSPSLPSSRARIDWMWTAMCFPRVAEPRTLRVSSIPMTSHSLKSSYSLWRSTNYNSVVIPGSARRRRWPLITASRHRHATGRTARAKNPVMHRWASAQPFASLISFYLSWPLNRSVQRAASQQTKAKSSPGMSNGAALVI